MDHWSKLIYQDGMLLLFKTHSKMLLTVMDIEFTLTPVFYLLALSYVGSASLSQEFQRLITFPC